jgi:Mg2+ and Co2+ transporter CorA
MSEMMKRYEEIGRILEALYDCQITAKSSQMIHELESEMQELEDAIAKGEEQ